MKKCVLIVLAMLMVGFQVSAQQVFSLGGSNSNIEIAIFSGISPGFSETQLDKVIHAFINYRLGQGQHTVEIIPMPDGRIMVIFRRIKPIPFPEPTMENIGN